jgi:hypothetical protein
MLIGIVSPVVGSSTHMLFERVTIRRVAPASISKMLHCFAREQRVFRNDLFTRSRAFLVAVSERRLQLLLPELEPILGDVQ